MSREQFAWPMGRWRRRLPPVAKVGKHATASWLLRYQRDGRGRHMGLGPVGLLSLSEARDKAREARRLLLDGIDPLEAKAASLRWGDEKG